MKTLLLISTTAFFIQICIAQTGTIDYFGEIFPGDSAVIFAPEIISQTGRLEAKITFSPDGNECYFEVVGLIPALNYKIYYTICVNNLWSDQVEASFSIDNNVGSPVFSLNGEKLYFTSFNNDFTRSDIWMVERTSEGLGEPQLLPAPINSDSMELGYSETADSIIYIDSWRPGGSGGPDIWCIRHSSSQAENLGPIVNSTAYDSDPCIAPDGSYLIFSSERYYSVGGNLLCISFNKGNNEWTAPVNMNSGGAKINNNVAHHMNPSLSPDGKFLFFARHSVDTIMDIYWVSTHIIAGLKKYVFAPKLNRQIPDINISTDSVLSYVIPENTFSCEYGVETLKYTATLNNGSVLPSWLSFNPDTRTLTVNSNVPETDTIKIVATNADTVSAMCIFNITVNSITGISQVEEQEIGIFPNPATGLFTISFGITRVKEALVEICNLQGNLIISETFHDTAIATIDLTSFLNGIYMIKVTTEELTYKKKILKE
jgi:hypothetical protein